jgi:sulfate adenylyltransferase
VANRDAYLPSTEVTRADTVRDISGTELRRHLHEGTEIPPGSAFRTW